MTEKQTLISRVQCLSCGDIIESLYTHDYVTCSCGETSLDGGTSYKLVSGSNTKDMSITTEDEFSAIRLHLKRGSRGKNGDQPLCWVRLCDIDDEYLLNLIKYCEDLAQCVKPSPHYPYYIMEKEYRCL